MKLRPDDEIRRARMVWLGWKGTTLPVQWPYAKWLLYGGLFLGSTITLFAIFRTVYLIPTCAVVSYFATTAIWDRTDPDRPARKVIRTALTDWRADRDDGTDTELPALDASHVRLGGRR